MFISLDIPKPTTTSAPRGEGSYGGDVTDTDDDVTMWFGDRFSDWAYQFVEQSLLTLQIVCDQSAMASMQGEQSANAGQAGGHVAALIIVREENRRRGKEGNVWVCS